MTVTAASPMYIEGLETCLYNGWCPKREEKKTAAQMPQLAACCLFTTACSLPSNKIDQHVVLLVAFVRRDIHWLVLLYFIMHFTNQCIDTDL